MVEKINKVIKVISVVNALISSKTSCYVRPPP